jgi:hypothetical protein
MAAQNVAQLKSLRKEHDKALPPKNPTLGEFLHISPP